MGKREKFSQLRIGREFIGIVSKLGLPIFQDTSVRELKNFIVGQVK